MPLIQVFIATYNRSELVLRSINSVLSQDFDSFEIIVSDNSTNDETEMLVSQLNCDRLIYKRRNPSLPVIDHLNVILQEVTSDYFMIFHDDDVMFPNMLSALYEEINKDYTIIAAGSNAKINKNGYSLNELFYTYTQENLMLKTKDEVAFQYLQELGGIVPFPSYLYKKNVATNCRFNTAKGGKYCDAAFIMDITELGEVIFIAEPLMEYYFHKEQDSATHSTVDRSKLLSYISRTTKYNAKNKLIKNYRLTNIYNELRNGISNGSIPFYSNRYSRIMRILLKSYKFVFFTKALIVGIFSILKHHQKK